MSTTIRNPSVESPAAHPPAKSRLVWIGLAIALGAFSVFFVQLFAAKRLITPWYLPIGGTLAGLFAIAGAVERRRWWAWLIANGGCVLAEMQWASAVVHT